MSTQVIVYILTALAAVVIVLTRLRLRQETGGAGRFQVGRRLVDVHTTAGVLARRFLACDLDARMEDPEARPFQPGFMDNNQDRPAELL